MGITGGGAPSGPGAPCGSRSDAWQLLRFRTAGGAEVEYLPGCGSLYVGEVAITRAELPRLRSLLNRIEAAWGGTHTRGEPG